MPEQCRKGNYMVLDDIRRSMDYEASSTLCDRDLKHGWCRFKLNGADAVMPTSAVEVTDYNNNDDG